LICGNNGATQPSDDRSLTDFDEGLAMDTNAGTFDRVLRIAAGALLLALAAAGYIGAWAYLGVLGVLTGLTGFCPAYKIFGIRTCRAPDPAAAPTKGGHH